MQLLERSSSQADEPPSDLPPGVGPFGVPPVFFGTVDPLLRVAGLPMTAPILTSSVSLSFVMS